ncbi:hypothetical protein D039_4177B, partial [Vibrio parahaemolyticus EKP-028]
NSKGEQNGCNS